MWKLVQTTNRILNLYSSLGSYCKYASLGYQKLRPILHFLVKILFWKIMKTDSLTPEFEMPALGCDLPELGHWWCYPCPTQITFLSVTEIISDAVWCGHKINLTGSIWISSLFDTFFRFPWDTCALQGLMWRRLKSTDFLLLTSDTLELGF